MANIQRKWQCSKPNKLLYFSSLIMSVFVVCPLIHRTVTYDTQNLKPFEIQKLFSILKLNVMPAHFLYTLNHFLFRFGNNSLRIIFRQQKMAIFNENCFKTKSSFLKYQTLS